MKFDLVKASRKLSEIDLKIVAGKLDIDVLWFRAMIHDGDWHINRHTHSSYEFHFIASGGCSVVLDDGEFEAKEGEFYLTAPGVFHEQRSIGDGKMVEYCINCDINLTDDAPSEEKFILEILRDTPCRSFKDAHGSIELFNRALEEAYYQHAGYYTNIKSLATMIITAASRAMSESVPIRYSVPLKNRKSDYRIEQIEKFIDDNISNAITVGDVAKYMHLSEKQVLRIVREAKGTSVKDLIVKSKFQKARELLRETDLSLKQISDMLGFSSEYYFNQFFKREEGYPPGCFRYNTQKPNV
ncbi:AraC family transcriptional regulator [Clostridium thermosuccinogenes]|nr:AraC family transcriptional regulator [Pseudoclostridium thermosuccinogenes]